MMQIFVALFAFAVLMVAVAVVARIKKDEEARRVRVSLNNRRHPRRGR